MKLKNKKTGKIYNLNEFCLYDNNGFAMRPFLKSLAELNEEWEDYEEPEGWWFIDRAYEPHATNSTLRNLDADREIGNYFGTKEEAERAVRKLKAWKRLKDKGFRFVEWQQHGITEDGVIDGAVYFEDAKNVNRSDLDLLFGGEE